MTPKEKNINAKGARRAAPPKATAPAPDWPPFKPLLPVSDLNLSTVLESQITVIKSFWTSKLCKDYVSFLRTLPLVTTPGTPKKGDALRVNDRFQTIDQAFANRLWVETGLRELVRGTDAQGEEVGMSAELQRLWGGDVVGLNPSIRIYRYAKGQFFDCHYDESNLLSIPNGSGSTTPAKTTWTLLLYLTSPATGCKGGETVFYPGDTFLPQKKQTAEKPVVVELETGMLLLHKHGNDCMLHEGREVTEGEKWVIRSDLCVRR